MTEFTKWRSLVDGEEIIVIPDVGELRSLWPGENYDSETDAWEDEQGNNTLSANGVSDGSINGNPGPEFNGTSDFFSVILDLDINAPYAITAAVEYPDDSGVKKVFCQENADDSRLNTDIRDSSYILTADTSISGGDPQGGPETIIYLVRENELLISVDDTIVASGSGGTVNLLANEEILVGDDGFDADRFFEGVMTHMALFESDLDAEERSEWHEYMSSFVT